jgi:hypothetical protein
MQSPAPVLPVLRAVFRLAAAMACAGPLAADVVCLKNGNKVEGEVSPGSKPGSIKVTLDKGLVVEFAESDIKEIQKRKSPAQEFDERLAACPKDDVEALLELADWAKERKLRSKEEVVYRRVLEIDPDDPVARRELGYAVHRNRWVKEADLKGKFGLVQFRGDWVTLEEKDRRLGEEMRKEVADLFRDVDSENQYIREYSVKKLLEYRDPRARAAVLSFLGDPRETVRVVALQVLAALEMAARKAKGANGAVKAPKAGPGKASKAPPPVPGPTDEEIGRALLDRVLTEDSRTVRTSLANALQKIHSRKLFDLALKALDGGSDPLRRDRAAEGVFFSLRKAWVPDLIAALPRRPSWAPATARGNPEVKSILVRIANQDLGWEAAAWTGWWEKNQARFVDED